MSWREKIDNKRFKITTGDGVDYFPLWKLSGTNTEFNYTSNEYPELPGTYVAKFLPKGKTRTFNVYFEGENAHDITLSFLNSASFREPWIVEHPFDGILRVQPISIRTVPTLNTVNLAINVQETIEQEGISTSETASEQVIRLSNEQNDSAVQNITDQPRDSSNIPQIKNDIDSLDANFIDVITDQNQSSNFSNLINEADRLSQNYVENAAELAIAMNNVNRFIGQSTASVSQRVRAIKNSTSAIFSNFPTVPSIEILSYSGFSAVSNLVCAANIAITPDDGDYTTVSDVLEVRDEISDYWNETIDQFSEYGGEIGRIGAELYELPEEPTRLAFEAVNAAIGRLNDIAFDAKIEVQYLVEKETDLINLVYLFYGEFGDQDELIDQIIEINQLGPKDIIQVSQGKLITYLI